MNGVVPIPEVLTEEYRASGLWADETLPSLLVRVAGQHPDRVAVVDDGGRRLTYADLDDQASRLAAALVERGVEPGDVVGVQLPNRAEASVVACAVERLGAIVNPLVPIYRDRELMYMAEKCQTKALVVPGTYRNYDHEALALRTAERVPTVRAVVSLADDPSPGVESFAALLKDGGRASAYASGSLAERKLDPDAVAAILFTSGTEADPKGVLHTHNTLLANNRSLARLLSLSEEDTVFMGSPVGHGTGYGFGIRLAIYLGGKLVLQDVWNAEAAAQLMAKEGASYTHASTPFAHDLLGVSGLRQLDLSRLRWFVTGGASIPTGFVERVREELGCLLLRLYGQTEAFMTTINRPGDDEETLETRDGRPAPGVEVQIWDDDDSELSAGVPGEAVCRGPHRCIGFVRDEDRARQTIREDGWMRMGDYCTMDERGYVAVVGRKKEVINRGGYKYSPLEVEDLLQLHPDVGRVAIVRMPDERLGEKGCAFVVPAGDASPTLEALIGYLRERGIAAYKLPERLEVLEELPATPSGKIQKYVLEQRLRDTLAAEPVQPA